MEVITLQTFVLFVDNVAHSKNLNRKKPAFYQQPNTKNFLILQKILQTHPFLMSQKFKTQSYQ